MELTWPSFETWNLELLTISPNTVHQHPMQAQRLCTCKAYQKIYTMISTLTCWSGKVITKPTVVFSVEIVVGACLVLDRLTVIRRAVWLNEKRQFEFCLYACPCDRKKFSISTVQPRGPILSRGWTRLCWEKNLFICALRLKHWNTGLEKLSFDFHESIMWNKQKLTHPCPKMSAIKWQARQLLLMPAVFSQI